MKHITTTLLLVCSSFFCLHAQKVETITTIASKIDDDIIFDSAGNLFGSNYIGGTVYKRTPDGVETVFTNGIGSPNGMAFNDDGTLIIAANTGNKLYKVFPDGSKVVLIPSISGPSGMLRMRNSDTILVTTYIQHKIWKLAPDGALIEYLSHPQFNGPVGLCYDDDGNLYVANFSDRKIFKVTPSGEITFLTQPPLGQNIGFLAYTHGYLYATAFNAHKIYKIDLDGNYHVWLGSTLGTTDGDASVAKFNRPNGIRPSTTGDTLYISDFGSKRVRMITDLNGTSNSSHLETPEWNLQVSPNPVNQSADIRFELPDPTRLSLSLYDIQGQLVQSILSETNLGAGKHQYQLQKNDLKPGVYYLHLLSSKGQNRVHQVLIL